MKYFRPAVFLTVLPALFLIPAAANSAMTRWSGTSASGTISSDSDCPLTVTHEDLRFVIRDFPKEHYTDPAEFIGYQSYVEASYTFFNPSDMTVQAGLAFPFGNEPLYFPHEENGKDLISRETEKYKVTVNGQDAGAVLRYTWHPVSYEPFDLQKDLPQLKDGYTEDDYYSPDLPVYRYTYITKQDSEISCELPKKEGIRYTAFRAVSVLNEEDRYRITLFPEDNGMIEIYVFGGALEEEPLLQTGEETIKAESKSEMTYADYVFRDYEAMRDIPETDYYNAYTAMLKEAGSEETYDPGLLRSSLMRWYQYTIELDPGETITNTVTAPVYPAIEKKYDPPVYEYKYLLSPASTWKEFGSLNITVETEYSMTDKKGREFSETENGYEVSYEALPEGELEFTLCTVPDPKKDSSGNLYLLVFLMPMILIALGVILLLFLICKMIGKIIRNSR